MVVRRTIHRMRERPRDERVAFAAMVAVSVTAILFIVWLGYLYFTFRGAFGTPDERDTAASSTALFAPPPLPTGLTQ